MKLKLYESGIRGMREIAKEYNKAWIYFHIDLDGVTSAIAMREYLKQYGIETTNAVPMQYGDVEYSIQKPPEDTIPVLVDFAHGKVFMKIHTDHHDKQIYYDRTSIAFSKAPSNAGTISTQISAKDIFSKEDVRVIDMIDSAGYAEEDISIDEIKNYIFNYNKNRTSIQNHLRFGVVVGKLLLAYKNKPGYLKTVAMDSKPSLMSMFQVMKRIVKENGWADLKQLQKNSEWYAKSQEEKKIPEGDIETINKLSNGENTLVGNCIVQIGGGNTRKSGAYDRYTAFKLYPDAKYFVMIWDTIGMIQVAKNNWNKANRTKDSHDYINLGELVISDVFNKKYSRLLNKKIYDISLLAIKKTMESKIEKEDIPEAIGFDYGELKALFGDLPNVSEKQKTFIEKAMKLKPQELMPDENDSEKRKQFKEKVIKFLNDFTIPLPEIIMKTSGGHPGITNLSGFQFLTVQRRIFGALKGGRNPYASLDPNWKPDPNKPKKESATLKIMKDIATDVVKLLNKDEQVINYWKNHEGEDPVQKIVYEGYNSKDKEDYQPGYIFQRGDNSWEVIDKKNGLYMIKSLEPATFSIADSEEDDSPVHDVSKFSTLYVDDYWISAGKEVKNPKPENDGDEEYLEESNDSADWEKNPPRFDTQKLINYKNFKLKIWNTSRDNKGNDYWVWIYPASSDNSKDLLFNFHNHDWNVVVSTIEKFSKKNNNDWNNPSKLGNEYLEDSKQINETFEQWEGADTEIIGLDESRDFQYKGAKIFTYAESVGFDNNGEDIIVYYATINMGYGKIIKLSDEIWMDLCSRVTNYIDNNSDLIYYNPKIDNIKGPGNDGDSDYLDETSPSRFNQHLDNVDKSFATVSAERSMPQVKDRPAQRALNHRRTKVLEKLLKIWGLKGYIKTKGGFDEKGQPRVEINGDLSEEDSFFVPNITKEQAVRLGKLFNQDSVMFKEKGSKEVKELRTNIKGGDEGIGNETGLVFIVGQGRHNIGHDKTYYSRPKSSMIKFAFNPEDESAS